MNRPKDLQIYRCNPVMRAQYFGVIFDQVLNFVDISTTPRVSYKFRG